MKHVKLSKLLFCILLLLVIFIHGSNVHIDIEVNYFQKATTLPVCKELQI